jgi:hypothetical protein
MSIFKNKVNAQEWFKSIADDKRLARIIDGRIDIIVYQDGFIDKSYMGKKIDDTIVKKWLPAYQKDIDEVITTLQNKINAIQDVINFLNPPKITK